MHEIDIARGMVLLAEPFSLDSNFRGSAVLLTEHDKEGSIGFIMNRPLELEIGDLVGEFPEFESTVYFGGPVATDSLHYLHNVGELLEDSIKVSQGVYWGGNFEKLKFLISSELIGRDNIRFYVGYSGWSSGQLMEEFDVGSWLAAPMDPNYLFKSDPSQLWGQIMNNKGSLYTVIARLDQNMN